MCRVCCECYAYQDRSSFSNTQWRKGDGSSRCKNCIRASLNLFHYTCTECGRAFNSYNKLKMHEQVHRPRTVTCPICGDKQFKSSANAVQHIESGYCSGCFGSRTNARKQIYKFAGSKKQMHQYMTNVPRITNGYYYSDDDDDDDNDIPDFPYQCNSCSKSFRQLSQLMQHQDQKHNNTYFALGCYTERC